MASAAIKTQGTTVTVGGDTFYEIRDVKTPSDKVTEIDTTSMASTIYKEFLPGLLDGGEASFSGLVTAGTIVASGAAPTACSINGDGVSFAFIGYISSAEYTAASDDVWKYTVTIRKVGTS